MCRCFEESLHDGLEAMFLLGIVCMPPESARSAKRARLVSRACQN